MHLGRSLVPLEGVEPRSAAIKVFREETPIASIDAEIDALARSSSPFLVHLEDLGADLNGRPVLVLERLGPMTLSQLILEREKVSAGEAVTLLASLIDGVRELHRVGVAHGHIRLSSISFDSVGTPVLLGFGHAVGVGPQPIEPGRRSLTPAEASAERRFVDDVEQVLAVARTVIAATGDASLAALEAEVAQTVPHDGSPVDPERRLESVRERLFDSADPEPVTLIAPQRGSPRSRAAAPLRVAVTDQSTTTVALHRRVIPMWLESLVPFLADLGAPLDRVRSALGAVRRPFWIAAGVGGALLVGALVITGVTDDGAASATSAGAQRIEAPPSTQPSPQPTTEIDPEPSVGGAPPDADAALIGEDPVAAAVALIDARYACISGTSVLCLDGVDQQNSAALEADSYLIRGLQDGTGEEPIDLRGAAPVLREYLGGSALVGLKLPVNPEVGVAPQVSVLIVRGEAGWRIRDLIVG